MHGCCFFRGTHPMFCHLTWPIPTPYSELVVCPLSRRVVITTSGGQKPYGQKGAGIFPPLKQSDSGSFLVHFCPTKLVPVSGPQIPWKPQQMMDSTGELLQANWFESQLIDVSPLLRSRRSSAWKNWKIACCCRKSWWSLAVSVVSFPIKIAVRQWYAMVSKKEFKLQLGVFNGFHPYEH